MFLQHLVVIKGGVTVERHKVHLKVFFNEIKRPIGICDLLFEFTSTTDCICSFISLMSFRTVILESDLLEADGPASSSSSLLEMCCTSECFRLPPFLFGSFSFARSVSRTQKNFLLPTFQKSIPILAMREASKEGGH